MNINIIDICILIVLGVSVVFGLYRGFISGVLSVAAVIGSTAFAFAAGGQLAAWLSSNQTLVDTLRYYTDAGSRINDLSLSVLTKAQVSSENVLSQILQKANLHPTFAETFIKQFQLAPDSMSISELMSQTIVSVSLSIISFLICFLIAFVVLSFVIHLIQYVFELPVLRHLDSLIGGVFGLARGVLLVFIFFALVPIVLAVVPVEQLGELIEASALAPIFDSQIILTILRGGI